MSYFKHEFFPIISLLWSDKKYPDTDLSDILSRNSGFTQLFDEPFVSTGQFIFLTEARISSFIPNIKVMAQLSASSQVLSVCPCFVCGCWYPRPGLCQSKKPHFCLDLTCLKECFNASSNSHEDRFRETFSNCRKNCCWVNLLQMLA